MKNEKVGVVLEKMGAKSLQTIKEICSLTGLGLSEVKNMTAKTPVTVIEVDGEGIARVIKEKLEALGNTVSISCESKPVEKPKKKADSATKKDSTAGTKKDSSTTKKSTAKSEEKAAAKPKSSAKPKKAAEKAEEPKATAPKKVTVSPEEIRNKGKEAELSGDENAAIKLYFEAAKYADIEAARAYLRLVNPKLNEFVDVKRAEKSGAKLVGIDEKLTKLKNKYYILHPTDAEKIIKAIDKSKFADSPYADRLKALCYADTRPEHFRYLEAAANRGDYLALEELIAFHSKGKEGAAASETKPYLDKFWHFLFVAFAFAEKRIAWFTNKKLQNKYPRAFSLIYKDDFKNYMLNMVAKGLTRIIEDEIFPAEGSESQPVSEEMRAQIFHWISYLVGNFQPHEMPDFGRYYLVYMLSEGYGCDKDEQKATELVSGSVSTSSGSFTSLEYHMRGQKMAEVAAYLVGCNRLESNVDFARETFTFAAENGRLEKYKSLAGKRLADLNMPTVDSKSGQEESVKPEYGAKIERVEYDTGVYEGEMVDGYRHGKGKYTYTDGSEYEGDWVKGKKTGYGVYRTYNKKRHDGSAFVEYYYEGEWKDGEKHGKGLWQYAKEYYQGEIKVYQSYDGEWKNGKKHGHGAFSILSRVYEGEFVEGKEEGLFVDYESDAKAQKKYLSWYHNGEQVVGSVPYDPSLKTMVDLQRVKAVEDAAKRPKTTSAPQSGNDDNSLITRWGKIMEGFDGGAGDNAEVFFKTYMNDLIDNFCSIPDYYWTGNGFSPELDEILSELTGYDMTKRINDYFKIVIDKEYEEGPLWVVYNVADDVFDAACDLRDNFEYRKFCLAVKLARMLAFISGFYMGVQCFTQFELDKTNLAYMTLYRSFGEGFERNAESLTGLYYGRWMVNDDPSEPILTADRELLLNEWANGALLDALLESDSLYFDGWLIDVSEIVEYKTEKLGTVKYYGGQSIYDNDDPITDTYADSTEVLELAERFIEAGDQWEAAKMLCDYLHLSLEDIVNEGEDRVLDCEDVPGLIGCVLNDGLDMESVEYDNYDYKNLLSLCLVAERRYSDTENLMYWARRMFYDVESCTESSEVPFADKDDCLSWLYLRRIALTGDPTEPIGDYADFNLDTWVEDCYGEILDARLSSGEYMQVDGRISK